MLEHNQAFADRAPVDFLIKWNPRKESKDDWLVYAEPHGRWEAPREGKRVAVFSVDHQRIWKGYEYTVRRVMRLTERTIDRKGQLLLAPEIELECRLPNAGLRVTKRAFLRRLSESGRIDVSRTE